MKKDVKETRKTMEKDNGGIRSSGTQERQGEGKLRCEGRQVIRYGAGGMM